MNVYKIRIFAGGEAIGKPVWEQEIRAPTDEDAIMQTKERSAIPASTIRAPFVVLSTEAYKTIWSTATEDTVSP